MNTLTSLTHILKRHTHTHAIFGFIFLPPLFTQIQHTHKCMPRVLGNIFKGHTNVGTYMKSLEYEVVSVFAKLMKLICSLP